MIIDIEKELTKNSTLGHYKPDEFGEQSNYYSVCTEKFEAPFFCSAQHGEKCVDGVYYCPHRWWKPLNQQLFIKGW